MCIAQSIKGHLEGVSTEEIVIVCIGSDRILGDTLGPLVGSRLVEANLPAHIYGTLDATVTAVNIEKIVKEIEEKHPNRFVIAVDAVLGFNIEKIEVRPEPVRPGEGIGKNLPPVGDISIGGVVALDGFMPYTTLQTTPLSRVVRMANSIADGIIDAVGVMEDAV